MATLSAVVSGNTPGTPTFFYESPTEATVVASSPEALRSWWQSVKNNPPFHHICADRDDDAPHTYRLRLGLGYINAGEEITRLFLQHSIPLRNCPDANIVKQVLKCPDTLYTIGDAKYQIRSLISDRGCYGDVFLAFDVTHQRSAAIKVLRIAEDGEASVLRRLQRSGSHPNIVQFYGSHQIFGRTWIAMEYIQGKTLGQFCRSPDATSETDNEFRLQYKNAMAFIARSGVQCERENDNDNVLVTMINGKPVIKLIDFGTLARR